MGLLILISFLIEVGVLFYLEEKAWNTIYTPLNFLMLPYVLVLFVTIIISGNWVVDFHYPSILYWNVGLLLFAIPSYALSYVIRKNGKPVYNPISDEGISDVVVVITVLMCLAFLYRLKQTLGSSTATIGTDDFGMDYDGHGLWAHLSKINSLLLVLCIYYVSHEKRWLWIPILLFIFFAFIHQVKGWIIIPCLAGLGLRLYTGKTHLTARLMLFIIIGGIMVFLISYVMSLVIGQNAVFGTTIIEFIVRHFVHYLTSGTMGFSMDMTAGFPDRGSFQILCAPFVNIINLLSGSDEIVTPINSLYYFTGINYTNTRSMFGTMAINSNAIQFAGATLVISFYSYALKAISVRFNNIYVNAILFYQCALLSMGWFDYYYGQLDSIEVPAMALMIMVIVTLLDPVKKRQTT